MKASLAILLTLAAAPALAQSDLPMTGAAPNAPPTSPGQPGVAPEPAAQPRPGPAAAPSRGFQRGDDLPVIAAPKKAKPFRAGGEAFIQVFPTSSRRVPTSSGTSFSTTQYQMGGYFGGRFLAGYSPIRFFRFSGMASLGYVAAGRAPGSGDDGVMMGLGAETSFEASQSAIPFVRLTYEWTLQQMSQSSNGTLADAAANLVVGGRFGHAFSAYLMLGGDYAGGFSSGLGASIGFF